MNPTLLRDLILAGHRVACKDNDWEWIVFLFIRWDWQIQWTHSSINIKWCIEEWLSSITWNDDDIKNSFTWEYKIVTPLPQPPKVWDTVELLEICRELPRFNEWYEGKKDMVWNKYKVKSIDIAWRISCWTEYEEDCHNFQTRQVAKCEPEKAQSIQSEEQFWDTIVFNWRTYKAI